MVWESDILEKSFERKYQELFDEIVSSNHYWSCDEGFGSKYRLKKFKIEIFQNFDPKSSKFTRGKMPSSKLLPSRSRVFDWNTFLIGPGITGCPRFSSIGQKQSGNFGQNPITARKKLKNELLVMFSERLG